MDPAVQKVTKQTQKKVNNKKHGGKLNETNLLKEAEGEIRKCLGKGRKGEDILQLVLDITS